MVAVVFTQLNFSILKLCFCKIWPMYVFVLDVQSLTIFMSLFSLLMPARSLLVAPTLPTSWMEMTGLAPGSTERTEQPTCTHSDNQTNQTISASNAKCTDILVYFKFSNYYCSKIQKNSREVTHHFSEHQILCHSECGGEDSSTQRDSVSLDSQWPPHLQHI